MHGLGGRMATRVVHGGEHLVFDHAAQFFTVTDERFQKVVDEWLARGLVREWRSLIGELKAGGRFRPIPSSTPRYIGVKGMLYHETDSTIVKSVT
jgi:predicted NAD/FAD-dependent oxidoreductase